MAKRKESRKKRGLRVDAESLRAAVAWAVDRRIFADLKVHGNTTWQFVDLVLLAIVWVWSGDSKLTGAFTEAHRWSIQTLGRAAVGTFQGLLKALVTWTDTIRPLLEQCWHRWMQDVGGEHWRIGRWLPLAVDGSRVSAPRTKENESRFCAPDYGNSLMADYRRKKRREKLGRRRVPRKVTPVKPQIWLTLLWHMGLHMPWTWKTGPSYASERDHFKELLDEQKFPENTLFCADAGFTGYELWTRILEAGHSFLIRVGSNVRLLRKLGAVRESGGIVYFWPDHAARQKSPPLTLRLLELQVGKGTMWLVTNVLNRRQLSDAEAIRLYKLRWGVELQFRTVKQTFGRCKLRSRTPDRAMAELHWSMLGLWLIQLFAVKEQIAIGETPEHCSVALAIQIVRETIQHEAGRPSESFAAKIRRAGKDRYHRRRPKRGRYRPEIKNRGRAGKPKIANASAKQKANYRAYLKSAA